MQVRAMYLMLAALALAAVAAIMLSNRAPGPDDSHLWMGDVRAASWSPPPNMRVNDGRQSYETGCPLGSDTDRSGPLVKAWIDALNEANITFLAAGSEALRALRFGSNTVRLGSDHLGLAVCSPLISPVWVPAQSHVIIGCAALLATGTPEAWHS